MQNKSMTGHMAAFAGSMALAATCWGIAVHACCEEVWSIQNGDGGAPCTGTSVKWCESAPNIVNHNAKEQALFPRNARCFGHTQGSNVMQAQCGQSIPGWIQVPGSFTSGDGRTLCCYINTTGLPSNYTEQNFQITPCTSSDCKYIP